VTGGAPVEASGAPGPVEAAVRRGLRALVRRVFVAMGRGHDDPHFECLTETRTDPCDGLNERGAGHVCVCSCRRCNLTIHGMAVCVCRGCDARACGLHVTTRLALLEEDAR
jgi:hypothetical protein